MDIAAYVRTKDKKAILHQSVLYINLSIDETTDVSCFGNLQLVATYIDPATKNQAATCIGLVDCSGKQTAKAIFDLVSDVLLAYEIPWTKVLSVCTDDASNLTGRVNGCNYEGCRIRILIER